jgi:hypothetical protein
MALPKGFHSDTEIREMDASAAVPPKLFQLLTVDLPVDKATSSAGSTSIHHSRCREEEKKGLHNSHCDPRKNTDASFSYPRDFLSQRGAEIRGRFLITSFLGRFSYVLDVVPRSL